MTMWQQLRACISELHPARLTERVNAYTRRVHIRRAVYHADSVGLPLHEADRILAKHLVSYGLTTQCPIDWERVHDDMTARAIELHAGRDDA